MHTKRESGICEERSRTGGEGQGEETKERTEKGKRGETRGINIGGKGREEDYKEEKNRNREREREYICSVFSKGGP